MGTLLKTSTLIQKNFWLCLMIVSLAFTLLGAKDVTVEVMNRSKRTHDFDNKFEDWCVKTSQTLPSNVRKSFKKLTRNEKELLYLSNR